MNCKKRLERLEEDYFRSRGGDGLFSSEHQCLFESHKLPPFISSRNAVRRISERSAAVRSSIVDPRAATGPKTPQDPAEVTSQEPDESDDDHLFRESLRRF